MADNWIVDGHEKKALHQPYHPSQPTPSSPSFPPCLTDLSTYLGFFLTFLLLLFISFHLHSYVRFASVSRPFRGTYSLLAWSLRLFPEPRKLTRPPATSIPSILRHPLAVFCVLIRPSFGVPGLPFDASFPLLAHCDHHSRYSILSAGCFDRFGEHGPEIV